MKADRYATDSPYEGAQMFMRDGRNFHLGYSRISSYEQCPKMFKLSYVDKIRGPAKPHIVKGTAYHNTVEGLLKHKIEHKDLMPHFQALEMARELSRKEELTENYVEHVVSATDFYYHTLYPRHKPMLVECSFEIWRGGVRMTGRIDLVEEDGWIIDHKFSADTWAMTRAKFGPQPIIYQWAAVDCIEKLYPGWEFKGFAYNIIRIFPAPKVQILRIKKLSKEKSDWWEDNIFESAKGIRRGYFPAIPSERVCGYCDHKSICKPVIYCPKEELIGNRADDEDDV